MATTSYEASMNKPLLDRKGGKGIVVSSPTMAFSINKNIFFFWEFKSILGFCATLA